MVTVLTSPLELLFLPLPLAIKPYLKLKKIKTCPTRNRVACPQLLCLRPLVSRTSWKDISSSLHFLKETWIQLFLCSWTPKAHRTVETFLLLQNLELANVLRLLRVLALFMGKPREEKKHPKEITIQLSRYHLGRLSCSVCLFITCYLYHSIFSLSTPSSDLSFFVGFEVLTPRRPGRLWGPPSLLFNGYRGFLPGGKAAGAWSWPLPSI
jgi:hypothetical protein